MLTSQSLCLRSGSRLYPGGPAGRLELILNVEYIRILSTSAVGCSERVVAAGEAVGVHRRTGSLWFSERLFPPRPRRRSHERDAVGVGNGPDWAFCNCGFRSRLRLRLWYSLDDFPAATRASSRTTTRAAHFLALAIFNQAAPAHGRYSAPHPCSPPGVRLSKNPEFRCFGL